MKNKNKKNTLFIFSSIFLALFLFFGSLIYWLFFSMNRLPVGEYLSESDSPILEMEHLPEGEPLSESNSQNSKYTIKFYLCNGGATVDYAIRGELIQKNKAPKNIYWEYKVRNVDVNWIDEDTVTINGRTLNLPNDIYDFRRDKK